MLEPEYSNISAIRSLLEHLPENSILHLANSNSVRLAELFQIKDSVRVFGNRGAHGIDGSMSAFLGQAYIAEEISFLVIGDLSFFYDMNCLFCGYIRNNVRIMLCNDFGAGMFHVSPGTKLLPHIDDYVGGKHDCTAESVAECIGAQYLCARNKQEFDLALVDFVSGSKDKPVIFEVFTDKVHDARVLKKYYKNNKIKALICGNKETLLKAIVRKARK